MPTWSLPLADGPGSWAEEEEEEREQTPTGLLSGPRGGKAFESRDSTQIREGNSGSSLGLVLLDSVFLHRSRSCSLVPFHPHSHLFSPRSLSSLLPRPRFVSATSGSGSPHHFPLSIHRAGLSLSLSCVCVFSFLLVGTGRRTVPLLVHPSFSSLARYLVCCSFSFPAFTPSCFLITHSCVTPPLASILFSPSRLLPPARPTLASPRRRIATHRLHLSIYNKTPPPTCCTIIPPKELSPASNRLRWARMRRRRSRTRASHLLLERARDRIRSQPRRSATSTQSVLFSSRRDASDASSRIEFE